MESIRFSLNREDLEKIGRGTLIAGAGAALTYAGTAFLGLQYVVTIGERSLDLTPLVVAFLASAVNAGRKWLSGKTPDDRSFM